MDSDDSNRVTECMKVLCNVLPPIAIHNGWTPDVMVMALLGMSVSIVTTHNTEPLKKEELEAHLTAILQFFFEEAFAPDVFTFKCKGCGEIAMYINRDCQMGKAGGIGHSKPAEHANKIPVQCSLYRQLSPQEYWALHENEERLEAPSSIELIPKKGKHS